MEAKAVKFGGSSLADANQFKKVAEIIKSDDARRYVVASAPGKRSADDIKVTETGSVASSDVKTEGKKWTFDNLDKFEPKVDFVEGGGYKASNASLSSDVDHTTGTGKSFKIDGKTATNNRVKLVNVFSPSDVGKTFTSKNLKYKVTIQS